MMAAPETSLDRERTTLKLVSDANAIQKHGEREIPEITAQKKKAILHGRVYATVMAPNQFSDMNLKSVSSGIDTVSSNIDVPEVYGHDDLLIASAGVEFKNMNMKGQIESTGIVGVRQSTAFLLRLFEKNIGLVIGANNRMDYDTALATKNSDLTRLDEDYSEVTSGYLFPPDQSPNAPARQTWTLHPKYIEGGNRLQELVSSAPSLASVSGVATAVATTVNDVSKAIFGGSGIASSSSRPKPNLPRPNLPRPALLSSSAPTAASFSEEDKMAFSPVSPLVDWIDRVVVTRELLDTTVETVGDNALGTLLSNMYFGPHAVQLSLVTFTIYGTRHLDPHQHTLQRQTVEYTHHFLHVDVRDWADNMVPSILGSRYARDLRKDLVMLNGYNEASALMILINALIYVYGNGRVPLSQSAVRLYVNGEPLEARLARIQRASNRSVSASATLVATGSSSKRGGGGGGGGLIAERELLADTQVTTAGPTNRVLVHCAAGIGRTGVILTLIQYFSPFNPAPHSWLNIVRGMRNVRKDMVMVNVQWKFLQYYTDMFAFNGEWITPDNPDMTPEEWTQGSGVLPEVYLSYIMLGRRNAITLFRERNEILSILLRLYYETIQHGVESYQNRTYTLRDEETELVNRTMIDLASGRQNLSPDGALRILQFQMSIVRVINGAQEEALPHPSSPEQRQAPLQFWSTASPGHDDMDQGRVIVPEGSGRDYMKSITKLHHLVTMYTSATNAVGSSSTTTPMMRTPPSSSRFFGGPVRRITFEPDDDEEDLSAPVSLVGGSTPYELTTGFRSLRGIDDDITPTTTPSPPPRARSGKRQSPPLFPAATSSSFSSPSSSNVASPSKRRKSRTSSSSSRRR